MVPAIKELREREPGLREAKDNLKQAVSELQTSCREVRERGIGQSNATMQTIRQRSAEITGENGLAKQFKELADRLMEDAEKARQAMHRLGHRSCVESLGQFQGQITVFRRETNLALGEKCNFDLSREDRAKQLGERLGGRGERSAGLDEEATRAALLDRRDPNNARLLDAAKNYQSSLPPDLQVPSPAKSDRDRVCGEACVSVLNLQRAEIAFGRGSPEWEAALEDARATRHRVFGR